MICLNGTTVFCKKCGEDIPRGQLIKHLKTAHPLEKK